MLEFNKIFEEINIKYSTHITEGVNSILESEDESKILEEVNNILYESLHDKIILDEKSLFEESQN
jgi:hypothetical protein